MTVRDLNPSTINVCKKTEVTAREPFFSHTINISNDQTLIMDITGRKKEEEEGVEVTVRELDPSTLSGGEVTAGKPSGATKRCT